MKKLILLTAIALGTISASAQTTVMGSKFTDNWSFTLKGGAAMSSKTVADHGFWKDARGLVGVELRKQITPGDVLTLHCELVEQHGPVGVGKASAWVDGKCAATAELTFVLTDPNA